MAKVKLRGVLGLLAALIEYVPPIVRAVKGIKRGKDREG